ncbi:hypothetical protein An02g03030 [Aspergillus niger]|uniref:Uncharacterized protein n=2 Tax=Aspergillus niger TaxID=5061 RepID=A2QCC2_ASPNC|nr:hypothetical protein An02g03030 [Aspergillus niger]CAK47586.1 hypothetical protein An02g03030 [Aspergillus niger]
MAVMPANPSTLPKMQQKNCMLDIGERLPTMTHSTCTYDFQGSLSRAYHYPTIRIQTAKDTTELQKARELNRSWKNAVKSSRSMIKAPSPHTENTGIR